MTVAQTIISCSSCSLSRAPENRSFALPSRGRTVAIPKCREQFLGDRRLRSLTTNRCFLMDVVVRSSVDPAGLPSGVPLPPGSWKMWLLGMVISAVLPFWKSKWGPLLKLKNEVETVVETADHVAEVVEKVAEGVEKVAEDVAEMLPEGGKLRSAVEFVEHVAEETAKDAHLVDGLLDKAEELENEVEEGVESLFERPKLNQPEAVGEVVIEVAKEAEDEPEVAKEAADEPEVAKEAADEPEVAKEAADEPASSV